MPPKQPNERGLGETEAFSDRVFSIGTKLVAVIVKEWVPKFAEEMGAKAEPYVRGCIGAGMLTLAASQLRLVGLDRESARQMFDESWESPPSGNSQSKETP